MSWWSLLPAGAALLTLAVGPGAAVLRLLGVRGMAALGAGPAVTFGLLGVLSVLFVPLGLPWRLPIVLIGLLVMVAAAWAVGRLLGATRGRAAAPRHPPLTARQAVAVGAALVAGVALLAFPMLSTLPSPDAPLQQWDGVFHLNALVTVRETGVATPFGAVAPLYGAGTLAPYYPTGWHAILAITPGAASVPAMTNVGVLVLGSGVWLLGLTGLAREVLGTRVLPLVLTPLLAATFVAYPVVQLTVLSQLPNGLSTALLPGALLVAVQAVRAVVTRPGAAQVVALLLAAGAAAAGVVTAHGSGLFSLAVLTVPLVVAVTVGWARRLWRAGRRTPASAVLLAVAALLAGAPVAMAHLDVLSAIVDFERSSGYSHLYAARRVLLDRTLTSSYPGDGTQHLAITAVTLAGVVLTFVRRRHRWLAVSFLLAVGLAVLAAGPEGNPLRWLAGFWYTQAARIAPVAVVPAVLLGAWALSELVSWFGGSRIRWGSADRDRAGWLPAVTAAAVAAVVATAVVRLPLQQHVVASAYVPEEIAYETMARTEELDLMRRAGAELPDDALVVGDPFNGAALLPAVAGVDVVFPQLGASGMSEPQLVLQERLARVHRDPLVCEALTAVGATHLYQDTAGRAAGAKVNSRTRGMRNVDVSTGFTLLDSAGTAGIYRIELCDD